MASDVDVMAVAETWLLPDVADSFVSIPGYNIYRVDTTSGVAKHGVCVYICSKIAFYPVFDSPPNTLVVYLPYLSLYIMVVHSPPSNSFRDDCLVVEYVEAFCSGKEVVIVGDFNLPSIDWKLDEALFLRYPAVTQLFVDCFRDVGLHQWVESSTFVSSGNILDLLLTTETDRVSVVEVLAPFPRCGHCPIYFQYVFLSETRGVDKSTMAPAKTYKSTFMTVTLGLT